MSNKTEATFHGGTYRHHRVTRIDTADGQRWACMFCPGMWETAGDVPPDGCTPRPAITHDPSPTGDGDRNQEGTTAS